MTRARILSSGVCLPECRVSNAQLPPHLDTSDEWIKSRTGISSRYIVSGNETTTSMAVAASKQAIARAGLSATDIDMIICATCTPDKMFPSTACLVQQQLEIHNTLIAFDISAACAGFLVALSIADQSIRSGSVQNALIIGSESMSKVLNWEDRSTCVLFGDGAGAMVLQACDEGGVEGVSIQSDGDYKDILSLNNSGMQSDKAFLCMTGQEVFKLAVTELHKSAESLLEKYQIRIEDIDCLIPHQANIRIIESLAKKLGMPMEKVVITLGSHGNTSSASIPLAFDHALQDQRLQRGDKLLFQAIGGGMVWGSALVQY